MCSVDKAHSIAAAGLSDVMPFVNQYFESVRSGSFYPEILDYIIYGAACVPMSQKLVKSVSVSTSLISYYCSNRNVRHILIDPEEYWVQNTFSGLETCGLKPPAYQPLPVVEKDVNIAVGVDFEY